MTAPSSVPYRPEAAILRWLTRLGPTSRAELRRRIKSTHRGGFDSAVGDLIASGQVSTEKTERGIRYRVETPKKPKRLRNSQLPCDGCNIRQRRPTGRLCGHCLVNAPQVSPRRREPVQLTSATAMERIGQ